MKQLKKLVTILLLGCLSASVYAQVQGTVVDTNGEPLIGVSIVEKGTKEGVSTDIDGHFSLKSPVGSTLVFSYIGYKKQELKAQAQMTVTLQEDAEVLEEVVVVGYGAQRKVNLTGSVASIGDESFQDKGAITDTRSALQGKMPGVTITRSSSAAGREGYDIKIRGEASVNNTSALVLVDGVPGGLSDINPDDIENITVLKDASAAIYGAKAAGGVILVTTKRGGVSKPQVSYKGSVSYRVKDSQYNWMSLDQWAKYLEELAYNDDYELRGSGRYTQMGSFPYDYIYALKTCDPRYMGTVQPYVDFGGTVTSIHDLGFIENDQYEDIFGNSVATQHSLSVSGGTERVKYNVSLGYMYNGSQLQFGIKENSQRLNFRANNDFNVAKWLDVQTSLSYDRNSSLYPTQSPSAANGNPPGSPFFSENGAAFGWESNLNCVARTKMGGSVNNATDILRASIQPKIHIIKGLDLNLVASMERKNWFNKEWTNKITWCDYSGEPYNFTSPTENRFKRYSRTLLGQNYQAYFNYMTDFNTGRTHNFSAMLGFQYEREDNEWFQTEIKGFADTDLHTLASHDAVNGTYELKDDGYTVATASYFGRLNYDYKGRYLVEVLGRYDGSSRFIRGKKWKPFYGVSAGWRISEESFMKDLTWLSNLKLRASYGETGNQNGIDNYDFVALINNNISSGTTHNYPIFGEDTEAGAKPTTTKTQKNVVALNRTWEVVKNTNVALDFGFLDNRLFGTFEYFWKTNDNMLVSATYPSVFGATAPKTNVGTLKVHGWELQLGWHDKIGKDFTYEVGFNISDARNELTSMPNASEITNYNVRTDYLEGYPLRSYWGLHYVGHLISNEEELNTYRAMLENADGTKLPDAQYLKIGDAMYADMDGDGDVDYDDIIYLGDSAPHYTYAINLNMSWKGIDLGLMFQGVGEAMIIRNQNALTTPGYNFYQNQGAQYYDKTYGTLGNDMSYQGEAGEFVYMGETVRPDASAYRTPYTDVYKAVPRWSERTKNHNNLYSDAFWRKQNMAYCRLKNLTVGYTLPKSIMAKAHIEKLRVYFTGTDLFTIKSNTDGTDPENSNQNPFAGTNGSAAYPFSRTFSFGLDLTF